MILQLHHIIGGHVDRLEHNLVQFQDLIGKLHVAQLTLHQHEVRPTVESNIL